MNIFKGSNEEPYKVNRRTAVKYATNFCPKSSLLGLSKYIVSNKQIETYI